jgi:ribosomal protein S18 acetylase RimI-like enzyme
MIEIRQATERDLPDLNQFETIQQHWNLVFDGQGRSMPQFVADSVAAGACEVAIVGGEIAGLIVLEYWFYGYGFINLLITRDKFRRQGVARRLMLHVEHQCRTTKLFTSTENSNLPMQALLDDLGYLRSGVVENLADEGQDEESELLYCKNLG